MSEVKTTKHSLKMAKASPEEVENLRRFFNTVETMFEKYNWQNDEQFIKVLKKKFNQVQWQRVVMGYEILVENMCDPNLSYLDYKPEIKNSYDNSDLEKAFESGYFEGINSFGDDSIRVDTAFELYFKKIEAEE